MKRLCEKPMKAVVIGDLMISPDTMEDAIKKSKLQIKEIKKIFWGPENTDEFAKQQLKIERQGPDAIEYPKELDEFLEDVDVIMTHFCPISEKVIQNAKNLKVIFVSRGGTENICIEAATKRNIPVVNVIRNAKPVADFVLGMILSLTRNISQSFYKIKQGIWEKNFFNSEYVRNLDAQKVGLVGFGNVGSELAKRLLALEVPVIVYDEYIKKEEMQKTFPKIKIVENLDELLKEADIVSIHLRLTDQTKGMIDQEFFRKMKKEAYFINTARGGLVKEEDLILALQEGEILGAALDVYDKEPLSKDSPLLQMSNVLLTPHIAGSTVDAIPKSPYMLMKEFDRMIEDKRYTRIVNLKSINF